MGATEVFFTESGREALVTRGEDSLTLEVGGRVIIERELDVHGEVDKEQD